MIRRTGLRCLISGALMAGIGLMIVRPAAAEDTAEFERLLKNLVGGSDFRVRTQAALALGASKSSRALEPLCRALADSNTTVRAASAAALGRLRVGGDCLQKRLSSESNATVKSAIQKALDPVFTPETKYYVAIGKISDKTGRPGDQIDEIVHRSMAQAAAGLASFTLAPAGESLSEAKRRLSGRAKVKPVFLAPRVPAFEYAN